MRVLDLQSLTGQDIDVPMENLTCTCHFLFPALKPTVKDVLLSFRPESGAGKSCARTDTAREYSSAVLFHADPLQAVIVAVVGDTFYDADVETKSFEFAFPSATLLSYLDRLRGPPSNHVVKWEESRQRFGTRARMSDFVNGRIHGCCGTRTVVCPIGYDDEQSPYVIIMDYNQWPIVQALQEHKERARDPPSQLWSRRWMVNIGRSFLSMSGHSYSNSPTPPGDLSLFSNLEEPTYLPYRYKTVHLPTTELQQWILRRDNMIVTEDAIFFTYRDFHAGNLVRVIIT